MKFDNGPPFASKEFSQYINPLGIHLSISSLLWPQGNSLVESFMNSLGKAICSAHAKYQACIQELARFLLCTASRSSVQLKNLGKFPTLNTNRHVIDRHCEARENDNLRKASGKEYAD